MNHVEEKILTEDSIDDNLSWSAYHASKEEKEKEIDLSAILPLFKEDSKSVAMIKHSMNVVQQAASFVNPGQTPVIAFDQPLYAISKTIQWNWKENFGEEKFVIIMGALHIEMAALKTLGKNFLRISTILYCNGYVI